MVERTTQRSAGVLLHITSLPAEHGIGDLGPAAYAFADFLAAARQSLWQILPISPTDPGAGNSPYSSISAYAGSTLLVSPELLVRDGLLEPRDLESRPAGPPGRCDYEAAAAHKAPLFEKAYERFKAGGAGKAEYDEFCATHAGWLEDFALFVAIKRRLGGKPWHEWPAPLRDRTAADLARVRRAAADEIDLEKFLQFVFFKQWKALKAYCNGKGIRLIGDIPIYVNHDSAQTWSAPHVFKLDKHGMPAFMAGVPPDYFSATGQLWGNPVYRWEVLEADGYRWWKDRIAHNLELFDAIRIDHFRGFVAYWEVPAGEKTAVKGKWVEAPAEKLFSALLESFHGIAIIAEDLGIITEDVRAIMKRFGFPGMKILLFAFGEDMPAHPYLPHNFVPNCVAYTGTHDNNTARGWFEKEARDEDRKRLFEYLGREITAAEAPAELIRLVMGSVAGAAILPMQDVLGLGEEARMNRPSIPSGNWEWRLLPGQASAEEAARLAAVTRLYGRAPVK